MTGNCHLGRERSFPLIESWSVYYGNSSSSSPPNRSRSPISNRFGENSDRNGTTSWTIAFANHAKRFETESEPDTNPIKTSFAVLDILGGDKCSALLEAHLYSQLPPANITHPQRISPPKIPDAIMSL